MLYSQQAVRDIQEALPSRNISVQDVALALSRHVSTALCDVFGHVSLEGDLVFLLFPVVASPSRTLAETCIDEAHVLSESINQQSPYLKTVAVTSFLLKSRLRTSQLSAVPASTESPRFSVLLLCLTLFVSTCTWL